MASRSIKTIGKATVPQPQPARPVRPTRQLRAAIQAPAMKTSSKAKAASKPRKPRVQNDEPLTPIEPKPEPLFDPLAEAVETEPEADNDSEESANVKMLERAMTRSGVAAIRDRQDPRIQYINLLNNSGMVTPVHPKFVPAKLVDGYRFLVHASVVPTDKGDPHTKLKSKDARSVAQPASILEALVTWHVQMQHDRANAAYSKNKDLDWTWLAKSEKMVRKPSLLGSV